MRIQAYTSIDVSRSVVQISHRIKKVIFYFDQTKVMSHHINKVAKCTDILWPNANQSGS